MKKMSMICRPYMYQKRLTEYTQFVPTTNNIEDECNNIRNLFKKVGNEVLGKKRVNKGKRDLKIWKEEIEQVKQ